MATVVIEKLPPMDYASGCVALAADYGHPSWEQQPEVLAIRQAVFAALDLLVSKSSVLEKLKGRKVVVKPNLVLVYQDIGTQRRSYPETTDPRVLDALVLWLQSVAQCSAIVIAESSGRGSPTRASFALSGVDRLAKKRGCELLALEEQAVDRYFLPKAKVQREILVPQIFSEVVRGEAAYISVPKLKTNLYTGVTLGFKNAMGVIPYNLRQRAHHYAIDRKLVEMLYLFKPDVVLIDGVVGGEGECPAPVDPVDSRMILAGDHAVECERAATRLMGFNPADLALMQIADELGFGSGQAPLILGPQEAVAFRPADASLVSARVRRLFPQLTVLYGLPRNDIELPEGKLPDSDQGRALVARMEQSCRGGCVASTRFGLSMLEAEGQNFSRPALLLIGPGLTFRQEQVWLDADGTVWDRRRLVDFAGPKAVIGSCGKEVAADCDWFVEGCMPLANAPHAILHKLAGTSCALLSRRNRHILLLLNSMLQQRKARIKRLRRGERLDVLFPLNNQNDQIPEYLETQAAGLPAGQDWLEWPMERLLDPVERRSLIAAEDSFTISSITGILSPGLGMKLRWSSIAAITTVLTWLPLFLGLAIWSKTMQPGINSGWLFGVFCALFFMHLMELPFALRTLDKMTAPLHPGSKGKAAMILKTLLTGFPAWLPYHRGDLTHKSHQTN
ncbi:MAG: DUF362 domain-containing protein [Spirochaetes bacterium]|nr:DUF362 domain-containing protein [Spirochaetota bacterium]